MLSAIYVWIKQYLKGVSVFATICMIIKWGLMWNQLILELKTKGYICTELGENFVKDTLQKNIYTILLPSRFKWGFTVQSAFTNVFSVQEF